MKEYIIDGQYVNSLGDFESEIIFLLRQNLKMPDTRESIELEKKEKSKERGNFNAINDYFRELTPTDEHVILRIINSDHIREVLGYEATIKCYELALIWSKKQVENGRIEYQATVESDKQEVERIKKHIGQTLFDQIVAMILENYKIHLRLE